MSFLLIPTRNRPSSLKSVLNYIEKFFPNRNIFIADGSDEDYRPKIRKVVKECSKDITVIHKVYPPELPFFERILDALNQIDDDIVTMGADDDYPQFNVIDKAVIELKKDTKAMIAISASIHLNMLNNNIFRARLNHAKPILNANPTTRAKLFAQWPFSTTYAPARKKHLLERYERANSSFLPGFYDFKTGIHDAMKGKIIAVPGIGFISTKNFSHSYLRPDDNLIFLRKSNEVLKIRDQFISDLQESGVDKEIAEKTSTHLIRCQIASLAGRIPTKMENFYNSNVFQDDMIQGQFKLFHRLFSNTKDRLSPGRMLKKLFLNSNNKNNELFERLQYIRDSLVNISNLTTDNYNEKSTYETLEEQSQSRLTKNTKTIKKTIKIIDDIKKLPLDNKHGFLVNVNTLKKINKT